MGNRMTSSLAALTECITPQLQAVDRLFTLELQSRLECVNVLVRHVSRFRGKMLRPCLVLLAGRACGGDGLNDAACDDCDRRRDGAHGDAGAR